MVNNYWLCLKCGTRTPWNVYETCPCGGRDKTIGHLDRMVGWVPNGDVLAYMRSRFDSRPTLQPRQLASSTEHWIDGQVYEIRTQRFKSMVNPGPSGSSLALRYRIKGEKIWGPRYAIMPIGLWNDEEELWVRHHEDSALELVKADLAGGDPPADTDWYQDHWEAAFAEF